MHSSSRCVVARRWPGGWSLEVIDAGRPWLAPLQPGLDRVLAAWQQGTCVAEALNQLIQAQVLAPQLAAGPLRFVPQAERPAGEAYETFIHRSARVPTRDHLHDLSNGLVWLRWPDLKRRLNALQAGEIGRHGVQAAAGRACGPPYLHAGRKPSIDR
jgi:hypothetical protein